MSDIMFDTETLGKTAGCIVLTIGAVEFDSTRIIKEFEVSIDPRDSQACGCHMDADTVMWWLDQSKKAQEALTANKALPLGQALNELTEAFNWQNKRVWCNGASFDFPILTGLYAKFGVQAPWAFYNEMDMRTIKNMVGRDKWKKMSVKPTIAHSALADAISQAKTLQKIFADEGAVRWAA
jgi:hypothetical protein